MKKNHKYFIPSNLIWIVLLLSIAGCAPVISKQIREQVKPDITFKDVLSDPDHYKGQMIILSGVIIESKSTQDGTLLEVLQRPAGFRGEPKDVDESGGRFLALEKHYLDAEVYTKGRSVTIAGEIVGKRIQPLGETEYTYPLLNVKEIYLWPIEKQYYYPYPYPYYYNDYWWWRTRFPHRHFRRHRRHRCSLEIFHTAQKGEYSMALATNLNNRKISFSRDSIV